MAKNRQRAENKGESSLWTEAAGKATPVDKLQLEPSRMVPSDIRRSAENADRANPFNVAVRIDGTIS